MKTIPLRGSKARGRVALVDDQDYELVIQYLWHVKEPGRRRQPKPHAVTNFPHPVDPGYYKTLGMHNLITGWDFVDHVNGDGLDNQRHNLREATRSQNAFNTRARGGTSLYKGVFWNSGKARWQAMICIDGRRRYIGRFDIEEDAARAYDDSAVELIGEFAVLNFPRDGGRSALAHAHLLRLPLNSNQFSGNSGAGS